MADNNPDYDAGVKAERARCFSICEAWQRPPYIASHFGPYGDYDLKVILRVAKLIQEEVAKSSQPE